MPRDWQHRRHKLSFIINAFTRISRPVFGGLTVHFNLADSNHARVRARTLTDDAFGFIGRERGIGPVGDLAE